MLSNEEAGEILVDEHFMNNPEIMVNSKMSLLSGKISVQNSNKKIKENANKKKSARDRSASKKSENTKNKIKKTKPKTNKTKSKKPKKNKKYTQIESIVVNSRKVTKFVPNEEANKSKKNAEALKPIASDNETTSPQSKITKLPQFFNPKKTSR